MVEMDESKKTGPVTRGIPGKESLWLDSVKQRQKDWAYIDTRLEIKDILHMVFPETYQNTYYNVALAFFEKLFREKFLEGEEIGKWSKRRDVEINEDKFERY